LAILNCATYEDALASLSSAAEVAPSALIHAAQSFSPSAVPEGEHPWVVIPHMVFAAVDVDITRVSFDAMHLVHGTRTVDPTSFEREGILPLGKMVDRIWRMLRDLCPEMTDSEWARFRGDVEVGNKFDAAWLYQHKVGRPSLHGPYGSLVREHTCYPIAGEHDYLASPEIIEDIARCSSFDLQERFNAAAKKCTVTFQERVVPLPAIEAALLYVYSKTRGETLSRASIYGHDCRGVGVEPHDIVAVECIG